MSTPKPIQCAILASDTTLYTAFVGTATWATLVSLDYTNTTVNDITVTTFWESSDGMTTRKLGQSVTVPANGSASWRGMVPLVNASEKIRAIASATGVDALGTVMEG